MQKEYTEASMHRTHRWAMRSLREFIDGDDGSQAVRRKATETSQTATHIFVFVCDSFAVVRTKNKTYGESRDYYFPPLSF